VIGIGFRGPVPEAALTALERAYDECAAPVRVELATSADNAAARMLSRRGYQLIGFEHVLVFNLRHRMEDRSKAGDAIVVAPATTGDASVWADAVATGFAHPDDRPYGEATETFTRDMIARVMVDMFDMSGFRAYLARIDGIVVGGAGMRVADGIAQLCGAATLPDFRRRGVQNALLATRLALAAVEGCDVAVVTTEPASRSQQNAERQGFALAYARAILVRDAASAVTS
jgi:ribosomal protein S18 acetylase RimI-like enzyme